LSNTKNVTIALKPKPQYKRYEKNWVAFEIDAVATIVDDRRIH